jgi:hypothetical protein
MTYQHCTIKTTVLSTIKEHCQNMSTVARKEFFFCIRQYNAASVV